MSDGHFDRTFLPKNSFQSALNMGKAMERKRCEDILHQTLEEVLSDHPNLIQTIQQTFEKKCSVRL